MQQTGHLLDFWARSYDQFGGRCTCCLVAARKLQKTPRMLHKDDLWPAIVSARFHTYLGRMFLLYIHMYRTIWNKVDWRIFRTTSCHFLHHSVWVNGGILIQPLCCIFFWGCLRSRFIGSQSVLLVYWFQVVFVGSLRVWLDKSSIQDAS
jgi:hypothetical protein